MADLAFSPQAQPPTRKGVGTSGAVGAWYRVWTGALIATLWAGCVPDDGPSHGFADQVYDEGSGGGTIEGLTRDTGAENVDPADGTWLQYSQLASCVDIGSESFDNLNRSLYLVEVIQDEFGLVEELWQACDIELTPVLNLQPVLLQPNYGTIYPILTHGGLLTATHIDAGYSSAPVIELWGMTMDDPGVESIPTDADDERIYDSDGDGNPGATLVFSTDVCEAYVAQRTATIYSGRYTTFDRIEGTAVMSTDQFVIDANQSFCRTAYVVRSNDVRNVFERQRVDGLGGSVNLDTDGDGAITCDEVRAGNEDFSHVVEALFSRLLVDDDV